MVRFAVVGHPYGIPRSKSNMPFIVCLIPGISMLAGLPNISRTSGQPMNKKQGYSYNVQLKIQGYLLRKGLKSSDLKAAAILRGSQVTGMKLKGVAYLEP